MNVFDLFARLSIDSSGYNDGLEKAKSFATASTAAIGAALGAASTAASEMGKEVSSSAEQAVDSISALTKAANDSGEAIEGAGDSSDTAKNKISDLSGTYEEAQGNVKNLTEELNRSDKATGATAKETRDLADTLDKAEKEASDLEEGLDNLSESTETAEKRFSVFGEVLKANLITEGAKLALEGVKKVGETVVDLSKQAVESYGEYEQLVGGVETLFKESSETVIQYAQNAYKTAELSANAYMETVTAFSASLLQSLGGDTQAAAELANTAITDMSDNANKMGTDMASIQNAYQGFSKQNFTMLDNLKLGYGGTQKEMYRLMQDAAKLDETFARTAVFSMDDKGHLEAGYADIVRAIHIVQTEMGITGTTALEAEHTISGSIASMKASWQNLITGMADDNANLDELINNFVDSAATAGENLIPRVEKALSAVGTLIERLSPVIAAELPILAQKIVPPVIRAAIKIISALAVALPSLIRPVFSTIMQSIDMAGHEISEKVPALGFIFDNLGAIITGLTVAFGAYKAALIAQKIATIAATVAQNGFNIALLANPIGLVVAAIAALVAALVYLWNTNEDFRNAVTQCWEAVSGAFSGFGGAILNLLSALAEGFGDFADAVITTIEFLWGVIGPAVEFGVEHIGTTVENLFTELTDMLNLFAAFFRGDTDAFLDALIDLLADKLGGLAESAFGWGYDLIKQFTGGILDGFPTLRDAVKGAAELVKRFLHFSKPDEGPLADFDSYAPDMMRLFAQGIKDNEGIVRRQIANSFNFGGVEDVAMGYDEFTVPVSGGSSRPQVLNITLELERSAFARAVYQLNNEESQRVGLQLAGGVGV